MLLTLRHILTLFVLCLSVLFKVTLSDEYSITLLIPARKRECVYHPIDKEKYASFEVDYQVTSGGNAEIGFVVESPKGFKVISDQRRSDATHKILLNDPSAGHGVYTFCFDNTHSIQQECRVFFDLFLMDTSGQFLGSFDEKMQVQPDVLQTMDASFDTFQRVTTNVKDNLNKIERIQKLYSSLELADRTALEKSFEMINFWSTIHLAVMAFAVAAQVFMVRSLFEDNSRVGRILRKGTLND